MDTLPGNVDDPRFDVADERGRHEPWTSTTAFVEQVKEEVIPRVMWVLSLILR
jgi:hypothetical protein